MFLKLFIYIYWLWWWVVKTWNVLLSFNHGLGKMSWEEGAKLDCPKLISRYILSIDTWLTVFQLTTFQSNILLKSFCTSVCCCWPHIIKLSGAVLIDNVITFRTGPENLKQSIDALKNKDTTSDASEEHNCAVSEQRFLGPLRNNL